MTDKPAGRIRIGIGGWNFPEWRQTFYPKGLSQKKELAYASERLTATEVNATFYRGQKPATVQTWHDEASDDFVFALKGNRFVSNRKDLADASVMTTSIGKFFDCEFQRLGAKLGPINWQLAGTKKFVPAEIDGFFKLLPREVDGVAMRHAIEPRHESFSDPEFVSICRAHGVAIVCGADAAEYPQVSDVTAPFVYCRIQGTRAEEPLGYSEAELDQWAGRLKAWAAGGQPEDFALTDGADPAPREPRDVFAFFIAGHKRVNPLAAQALIERLKD
ncbi:DUF72 domain-containing protein [Cucumibacter marinus]|uniref:DUF72 domain-containing protein n=1 Tax=Cucumibacter marinus TaxID=1121252 RepID=UPI001FE05481|nr:DUF72 domain-containing protein [Cucumibacter marinus]